MSIAHMQKAVHAFVKKVLYPITIASMVLWSLGPAVLPTPAYAGITVLTTVSSATSAQTIGSSSASTPILNIDAVASAAEMLASVKVAITPSAGFAMSDLAALDGPAGTTAFSIYRDNGTTQGVFDAGDTATILPGPIAVTETAGRLSKITPPAGPRQKTDTSQVISAGDLIFADVSAGGAPTTGYAWHIVTTGATGVSSASLRLDGAGVQPTFRGTSTYVSTFIPATSELYVINGTSNTVPAALTTGDIIFYQTGTSAGQWGLVTGNFSATAAPINGSNLSNGTYRISKVIGQTGSFVIPPTGTFTPTGAYTAPALGDIVHYMVQGGMTSGWGMVTNAGLTAGTFAIDGMSLTMGQTYRVSKITMYNPASALTTAIPTGGSAIQYGDVVFGIPTANPVVGYPMSNSFTNSVGWHMATGDTTGDAANLRLDDRTSAPTFGFTALIAVGEEVSVPADNTGDNAGADFFIAAKTSGGAVNGHAFTAALAPGSVTFSANTPTTTPTETVSQTYTIATTAQQSQSAGANTTAMDLGNGFLRLKESSGSEEAIRIQFGATDAGKMLTSIALTFAGANSSDPQPTWTSGAATSSELLNLATTNGGVTLWKDGGQPGFGLNGADDTQITLAANPTYGASGALTLTPVTPPTLAADNVYFIVLKSDTSGTTDNYAFRISLSGTAITTSGTSPTLCTPVAPAVTCTALQTGVIRIDKSAPTITSVAPVDPGNPTQLRVQFSEPVQKYNNSGAITFTSATDPFTYTDGGGTAQTIIGIQHNAFNNFAILTMSGALTSEDFDGSPATLAAASNQKIEDGAGNAMGTGVRSLAVPLGITTSSVPATYVGAAYTSDTPLVTFAAAGGTGPYTFAPNVAADADANTTTDGDKLAALGLTLAANGKVTATAVSNAPGSYPVTIKVTDSTAPTPATAYRTYTINVAAAQGSAFPTITAVESPSGAQGSQSLLLTVRGSNTTFVNGTTTAAFLLPPDLSGQTNGITVNSTTVINSTEAKVSITIANNAAAGARDIELTTGAQKASKQGGFNVTTAVAAGLNLVFPTDSATNVQKGGLVFQFNPSIRTDITHYRLVVSSAQVDNSTQDFPSAAVKLNYVFSKPNAATGTGTLASQGTTVTGTGTTFSAATLPPGTVIVASGQMRRVSSVQSTTSLTTDTAFNPVLAAGTTFSIVPGGNPCTTTVCNVQYNQQGVIKVNSVELDSNTTYYWRVETYTDPTPETAVNSIATATDLITTTVAKEKPSVRSFTTAQAGADSEMPQIDHRPLFGARANAALTMYARVSDRQARLTTTPTLSTTLFACQGTGCSLPAGDTSPSASATDGVVAGIPAGGVAGTGTIASTGTGVTGTGTAFQTQLAVGNFIYASGQMRRVQAIGSGSDTALTTDQPFSPAIAGGTSFTIFTVDQGLYFSYTLPVEIVGTNAGTTIKYQLVALDGANTYTFKQPNGSPFQFTTAAAGASSIAGTVKDTTDTCSTAVRQATVFTNGYGGAGTTTSNDANCTFTLSNLPAGNYELVAFKDGFSDARKSGNTGQTDAALKLGQGNTGGSGGDITKPHVIRQFPEPGRTVAGNKTGENIIVIFDKPMDQTTINATNMLVRTGTGTTLTNITDNGTWTYYPSRQRPEGGTENNIAIWQLSGSNTFGDNKQVNVTVRTTVKDESGNALEQDFNYAFFTGATATIQDGVIQGGTFNAGAFMPPQVKSSSPASGRFGVSLNTPLTVEFDTPMKDPDANCSTGYCLSNFVKLVTVSGTTETDVTSAAIDLVVLDDSKKIARINLKSSYNTGLLAASTQYRLKVLGGAKSATGIPASDPLTDPQGTRVIFPWNEKEFFVTGTTSDTNPPEVNGSYPGDAETNVRTDLAVVMVSFNKDMDASTITNSTFTLTANGTSQSGTVEYRPNEDQALFKLASPLSASTTYTITLTTGIKALNGQALASNVTRTFTTASTADTTAPQIAQMNVNDFSIVLTFTRPMNAARSTDDSWGTSVLNPAVYSLVKYGAQGFNPASAGTAVSLANALFEYDGMTNTVIISRLTLPTVVSQVPQYLYLSMDAAGDGNPDADGDNIAKDFTRLASMTTTGNAKTEQIRTSAGTGIGLAPGTISGGDKFQGMGKITQDNFSGATFGSVSRIEVWPFNMMAGQTTIYHFTVPISSQIPAGGAVVLTFPAGFDVSAAQQDVRSPMRRDLNGPGTGTITFKCLTNTTTLEGKSCAGTANATDTGTAQGGLADDGVVVNVGARTVTVYLSAATRSENNDAHDVLTFDIAGIKNSTVPKDTTSSGYKVEIVTVDASGGTVESFNDEPPIFLSQPGSNTLAVTITATGNNQNGTMTVFLNSQQMGHLEATSTNFSGGTTATATFSNLLDGQYEIMTKPFVSIGSSDFIGIRIPVRVDIDYAGTNASAVNAAKAVTLSAANTGTAVTINITGPANEPLDVFAGGPNDFRKKTVTLDNNGDGTGDNAPLGTTLNLPNGEWFLGVGPQMPDDPSQATTKPSTNYLMPKPKNVRISGASCYIESTTDSCNTTIALGSATKQIRGTVITVVDNVEKIIVGAEVFSQNPQDNIGTHAQSDAAGKFTLNVNAGTWNVGAMVPSTGAQSREYPVEVVNDAQTGGNTNLKIDGAATAVTATAAGTSFKLRVTKPDYTITGTVTDDSNRPMQNASVFAYRTDRPGGANAMTSSSGTYTLSVNAGTWRVSAGIPGFGQMPEQEVVISNENASNVNFSPAARGSSYYVVSGRTYQDSNGDGDYDSGEELGGVFIKIRRPGYGNDTTALSNGTYSIKVPAGNGYVVEGWDPVKNIHLPPTALFNVAADVSNKDLVLTALRTVTITFTSAVNNGMVKLQAQSGFVTERFIEPGTTSLTMQVPDASYQVGIQIAGIPITSGDIAASTIDTTYSNTTGIVVVNGNEGLTVTLPTNVRTIAGLVTDGTNPISDVWVNIGNSTTRVFNGSQTDSNGIFSIQVPDGSGYFINAMKKGYFREPTSLTISSSNGTGTVASAGTAVTGTGTAFATQLAVNSTITASGQTRRVTAITNATSLTVDSAFSPNINAGASFTFVSPQTLTMTQTTRTISGTVRIGSSGAPEAFVRAMKINGVASAEAISGDVGTRAEPDGSYSLLVSPGKWKLFAIAREYAEAEYSGGAIDMTSETVATGKDITLSTTVTLPAPKSQTISPTSGGTFDDQTSGIKMAIPPNALGSASSAQVEAKKTNNLRSTNTARPIIGLEITAVDSSGNPIKSLSDKVTIDVIETKAELAAQASATDSSINTKTEVEKLAIGFWDENAGSWTTLATSFTHLADSDSDGEIDDIVTAPLEDLSNIASVKLTAVTDHFSLYAPVVRTDPSAPSTPSGLAAAAASTTQVNLSWTAVSGATSYDIYRSTTQSGTYSRIGSEPTVSSGSTTTYSDTGLTASTTYFYKISALNSNGESAASSAVPGTTSTATSSSSSSSGGVVSSSSSSSQTTTTTTTTTATTITATNVSITNTNTVATVTKGITASTLGVSAINAANLEVKQTGSATTTTTEKKDVAAQQLKDMKSVDAKEKKAQDALTTLESMVTKGTVAPVALSQNVTRYEVKEKTTGKTTSVTRVEQMFAPSKDAKDVTIVMTVPKSVAERASALTFTGIQPEVLQDDPILRWTFAEVKAGETKDLSYQTNKNLDKLEVKNVAVAAAPVVGEMVWGFKDGKFQLMSKTEADALHETEEKAKKEVAPKEEKKTTAAPEKKTAVTKAKAAVKPLVMVKALPHLSAKAAMVVTNVLKRSAIIILPQDKGMAFYLDPKTQKRASLGRPAEAFEVMRSFGIGITNKDLEKIPESTTEMDTTFACKHAGKIFLQVQSKGEAWYVHPENCKRYFLNRPADAFDLMRKLALGVSTTDAEAIPVSEKASPATPASPVLDKLTSLARPLYNGMKGDDVKTLQTILEQKGYYIGVVSGTMDEATFAAVREMQLKEGLAKTTSPGFGTVGPATRAFVNKFLKEEPKPETAPAPKAADQTAAPAGESALDKLKRLMKK